MTIYKDDFYNPLPVPAIWMNKAERLGNTTVVEVAKALCDAYNDGYLAGVRVGEQTTRLLYAQPRSEMGG